MILLDVNVLVYAFKTSEPHHAATLAWLEGALTSPSTRVGLAESAVSGFVRIVTDHRIYAEPATSSHALNFVDSILASRRAGWVPPNDASWASFRQLVADDDRIRARLVPDAWLAALATSHGAAIATADRGFGRFRGIELIDPTR